MTTPPSPSCGRPWTTEEAWAWRHQHAPFIGYNYVPRTAVNTTEMWQADTFDPATIAQELAWAGRVGYNTCRVFLQYLVWDADPEGMIRRLEAFLALAARQRQRVMPVLFDDCAFAGREPYLGVQDAPKPGVHNSGWVPSPGLRRVTDRACWPRLRQYVQDIVGAFANDDRVLIWDLYNEPGNSRQGARLPLLEAACAWAREARPGQPLTVGAWMAYDGVMSRRMRGTLRHRLIPQLRRP